MELCNWTEYTYFEVLYFTLQYNMQIYANKIDVHHG